MIVNELVTKFSYQGTTAPINNYTNSLDGAFASLARIGAMAAIGTAGLFAFAKKSIDAADAIQDLSERTGVGAEAFQKLGYAATMSGSSADAMASSLDGLNRQIGLAVSGQAMQADVFKELGISLKDGSGKVKSADQVFLDLQSSIQKSGKSTQEIAGILRKLRLDPSLVQTMQRTSEEMATLGKEAEAAGIMTAEQVLQASEAEEAMDKFGMKLSGVSNQLALGLIPNMMKLLDVVMQGIYFIRDFVNNIIQLVTNVGKAIDATIGWQAGLLLAGAAAIWFGRTALIQMVIGFRALAVAMLTNPLTWWIVGLTALALVVEDLYQAFTGGESAIGDFFAKFDIDIVNSMINGFNLLMKIVSPIGLAFIGLGMIITGVAKTTAGFLNMFGAGIDTKGLDAMTAKLTAQATNMQAIAMGDKQAVANRAAYVPSAPTPQGAKQVAGPTTNNQIAVTVHGSTDPQKTANAVAKETRAAVTQKANGGI